MTGEYTCPHCETEIEVLFTPARPAPPCSNPNSPAFSDSGDPAELDGDYSKCPNCNAKLDEGEVLDFVTENIE